MGYQDQTRPRAAPGGPVPESRRPKGGRQRKAEVAIAALMRGATIKRAAEDAGIGYRTLKTWLASDWFPPLYQEAKDRLLDAVVNQLRSIGSEGVEALRAVVSNAESPPAARVSAGRAMLEILLRAVEVQDIVTRLARLEAREVMDTDDE